MRAKKSLGQHFLKSERALRSIVEAGNIGEGDTVLEIGPGRGALTEKLLATNCRVLAIEKDDELYDFLKNKFEKEISLGKLNLVHDDILNFKPVTYNLTDRNYKLISNIPYNLTGIIIKKFLEIDTQPKTIVLLVQKEVATRIVATNKKESILSISVKVYGVPKYIETVKAGSFVPAPSVDSAIISIEDISKEFFKNISEEDFFQMIRTGFQSKRKKLTSNISTIFPKNMVETAFQKLGLDPNTRAEDVNIENWRKLASSLINN